MRSNCSLRKRILAAVSVAAILTMLSSTALTRKIADRYREDFRLKGDLQLNIHGLALSNELGAKYMTWLIEEGGHLGLLGYVWQPGFMSAEIFGQAYGLHQIVDERVDNGYRLGYGVRTTLLPVSFFPLTFYAERQTTTMLSGTLPGREYFSEALGLDWVVAVPKKPRLFISLYGTRYGVQSESSVPSEFTGSYAGQDLHGETRIAKSTIIDNDEDSQVRAHYAIEERSSRHRYSNTYSDPSGETTPEDDFADSEYELLIQTFTLDGHAIVTKKTSLDFYTGGHVLHVKEGGESKNFNFMSITRYQPNPDFRGTARYTFSADSTGDSNSNSLGTIGNLRLLPYFGVMGGLNGRYTSFGSGSIYERIASESLSFGPWLRGKTGPIETSVQETGTVGSTQVDPGSSGILLAHSFGASSNWLVAPNHMLFMDGSIMNQIERATVGIDRDLYRIGTRWTSALTRRTMLGSSADVTYSRTLNRKVLEEEDEEEWETPETLDQPTGEDLIGATDDEEEVFRDILYRSERRTDFQAEVNASTWYDIWLNSSIGVGYRLTDSNRSLSLGHSFYATARTAYRPIPSQPLRISGSVTWLVLTLDEQVRNTLRVRVGASWSIRRLVFGASYNFELEDRFGVLYSRHVILFTASRSFDIGLF